MATKTFRIRPHLEYAPGAVTSMTVADCIDMIKQSRVATVGTLEMVREIMRALGWEEDEMEFAIHYALHGAPEVGSP